MAAVYHCCMNGEVSTWVTVIGSILSGGVLTALIQAFFGSKSSRLNVAQDAMKDLLDRHTKENITLRQEVQKIGDLQVSLERLRSKIALLESAHYDLPIPMWLKDVNGVMLAVNPAYEKQFLAPRGFYAKDYIGKTDKDIWPADIAKSYMDNDKQVLTTGEVYQGTEYAPDQHGVNHKLLTIKYPRYAGNFLIGIGGIAIDVDEDYGKPKGTAL